MSYYRWSTHAKERWEERIGPVPGERELTRLISESVEVQKFRRTFTPRGRPITVLGAYWHLGRDIILKVDEKARKIVTVLGYGKNGHN